MKYIMGSAALSLLLAVSCKKEKSDPPPAGNALLSIKLNAPYLLPEHIDSAFAVWKSNNQQQRVRLTQRNDSLLAGLDLFREGNGEMTILLYSNKKYRNQYPGQWVLRKTLLLQQHTALSYNGPASFQDANWYPRVALKDAIGHEAIIALRPDDAYFLVKEPGHPYLKLLVERAYWKTTGGIQQAGGAIWECTSNCTGRENEEYFTTLPARIGNKPWNHISITVLFETDVHGGGWIIGLEYDL